jgi:hypothetical protein
MKRSLKQWKQLDVISQFSLLTFMFILISAESLIISSNFSFIKIISFVLFGLFAINQMGSFILHRKYAKQYNTSLGRKIYFILLIIHHIVAATLLFVTWYSELWASVYYLFFSAIVLSLLYLFISIYELTMLKDSSNENLD